MNYSNFHGFLHVSSDFINFSQHPYHKIYIQITNNKPSQQQQTDFLLFSGSCLATVIIHYGQDGQWDWRTLIHLTDKCSATEIWYKIVCLHCNLYPPAFGALIISQLTIVYYHMPKLSNKIISPNLIFPCVIKSKSSLHTSNKNLALFIRCRIPHCLTRLVLKIQGR